MIELVASLSASLSVGLFVWVIASILLPKIDLQKLRLPQLRSKSRPRWSLVSFWLQRHRSRKKLDRLMDLFPQSLGMAIQALKTGQTVPQVLEYLSRESQELLRDEFFLICAEINLGASTEAALTTMTDRFPDFLEFHQFLEAFKISRQTGANLTHLLQVLLDGMEEKNRILRKMEAMTAQARLSGLLMGLLPLMLGVVFFIMDPALMTPLFTEKAGWGILLLALFLESIGFLWIRQLLRIEIG